MTVKSVMYLANGAANTERGPSEIIWGAQGSRNAFIPDFLTDPRLGRWFFEDFGQAGISPAPGSAASFTADRNWYAYLDTNGAITDSGIVGGGAHLAASTTAHQGVAIASLTTTFQLAPSSVLSAARLAFECRVQNSTASLAASTNDFFLGLAESGAKPASAIPITSTAGTLDTTGGLIGFHKRGGATHGTDFDFVYQVAGGTAVYETHLGNIINTVLGAAAAGATWYKLGFTYNPYAQAIIVSSTATGQTLGAVVRPLIQIYVNGLAAACFLDNGIVTGTAFPTGTLSPAIAWKQQSTTASVNADVDWIAVAQEFVA